MSRGNGDRESEGDRRDAFSCVFYTEFTVTCKQIDRFLSKLAVHKEKRRSLHGKLGPDKHAKKSKFPFLLGKSTLECVYTQTRSLLMHLQQPHRGCTHPSTRAYRIQNFVLVNYRFSITVLTQFIHCLFLFYAHIYVSDLSRTKEEVLLDYCRHSPRKKREH